MWGSVLGCGEVLEVCWDVMWESRLGCGGGRKKCGDVEKSWGRRGKVF